MLLNPFVPNAPFLKRSAKWYNGFHGFYPTLPSRSIKFQNALKGKIIFTFLDEISRRRSSNIHIWIEVTRSADCAVSLLISWRQSLVAILDGFSFSVVYHDRAGEFIIKETLSATELRTNARHRGITVENYGQLIFANLSSSWRETCMWGRFDGIIFSSKTVGRWRCKIFNWVRNVIIIGFAVSDNL